MKKYIYTLVFLLLAVSPRAEILDSLRHYSVEMRYSLGYTSSSSNSLTDTVAHTLVREAVNRMTALLRPIKRVETFTTSYRQSSYGLPDSALGVISVYWRKGDSIKTLQYLPIEEWSRTVATKTDENKDGQGSRPSYYDYIEDSVFVYPAPTNWGGLVDTFRVVTWGRINNLSSASDLSEIPVQYRPAVLDYATMKAAARRQHPFTEMFINLYRETMQSLNTSLNARKEANVVTPPNR